MRLPFLRSASSLPATAGMYQFDIEKNGGKARVHLRVDEDGSGVLVINAARMIHLNPTAAQMTYFHLIQKDDRQALESMRQAFNVSRKQLKTDYKLVTARVDGLLEADGNHCPVCDLGLETDMPFSVKLSAPYRMDLALTYRCNNNCSHCYNARPRDYPELDTETWKRIIDKIWSLRIPHVVFTGGEPTLREDLVELVAYAQEKGLVTGLNTNGRKLADNQFLQALVDAGLDHVQITIESFNPDVHDGMVMARGAWLDTLEGLRNAIASKLYVMTNTTLLQNNADHLANILDFLARENVPTIGLNALIYSGRGATVQTGLKESELPDLLALANQKTQENGQRLIWYTPTQYCQFNPILLRLGIKGCTAAYYNMCIEPDGQVIPCQSYYESLGGLLDSEWDSIWNHPHSLSLRERQNLPEGCQSCDFLVECGGGCPLAREHQSVSPIHQPFI